MSLPELGDTVIYWSSLFGKMEPFPAVLQKIHSDTVCDLHIFGGAHLGLQFHPRVPYSATPVSQCWSWRPPRRDEQEQQAQEAA